MRFVPVELPPSEGLLDVLTEIVGDARIVILGEELHGDGATFEGKARLSQLLLGRLGFDTMAWESPVHDVRRMNGLPDDTELDEVARTGLFGIWNGAEIEALLDFCRRAGVEHAGVDCQLLDGESGARVASSIAASAHAVGRSAREAEIRAFMRGDADELEVELLSLLTDLELSEDLERAADLRNVLADRRQTRIGSSVYEPYLRAREQGRSIALDPFDPVVIDSNSERDLAMADNALRLVESGRRVLLWAANYHAIRRLGAAEPYASQAPQVRTMGDELARHLGRGARTILGTSAGGTRWDLERWEAVDVDDRDPGGPERSWPEAPDPLLASVRTSTSMGPVHLMGVGPMTLSRPADHFDGVLHVTTQRVPAYTRW